MPIAIPSGAPLALRPAGGRNRTLPAERGRHRGSAGRPRAIACILSLFLGVPAGVDASPPLPCLVERFLPEPASAGARFGGAVALDTQGRFAIGVPGRDEVHLGSIESSTGVPRVERKLQGPAGSRFGASLALAQGFLVIGAPDSAPGGAAFGHDLRDPAAAAVELRPARASPGARAGTAVAIAEGIILVGAPEQGTGGVTTGGVFVFEWAGTGTGTGWRESSTLTPFDGGTEGGFGEAIAIGGDAIAVGAPRAAAARGEAGAVYLFARGSGAAPAAIARIELPDGVADEAFGAALAFTAGDLAIGVPYRDAAAPAAGAVAIVTRTRLAAAAASAPFGRIAPDLLLARSASPVAAALGSSLATGGNRLAAGAPADGGAAPLAGAVAIFARDPAGADPLRWREEMLLRPEPAAPGCEFGRALALAPVAGAGGSALLLLAGAPGDPERCGGAFGCDAGSASIAVVAGGADCDGDGVPDPCARRADPALDADGDGTIDRCRFRRGDLDRDGALTLADPILWLAAPLPGGACPAAADANGDAALDLADPVTLLGALFAGEPPPPPPFPGCGVGEGGSLPCSGAGCSP